MQFKFKKLFVLSMLAFASFATTEESHAQKVYAPIVDDEYEYYQELDSAYEAPSYYYQDNDQNYNYNYVAPQAAGYGYNYGQPNYKQAPNVYSQSKEIWDYNFLGH